ncbi:unnamed protein product [Paramecium pentaurelia]|uniref:Uncharacterized protein n=1 Tax=Paramecium pentaurelia TaxID=43138 RepID=A0A8S1WQN6_9CILI|nr:unnamed protein product [Paramecium pentaurelia]
MGISFCKIDNSSNINTIEIENLNSPPISAVQKPNSQLGRRNSQQFSSVGSVQTSQKSERQCSKCQNEISFTFVETKCKKNCQFHQLCMEEHLKNLIESGKPIIKCQCGTKINTNFLRQSSITGKMNLLTKLFEKQLDYILQSSSQIRRDEEVQNYVKENRLSKELDDYFLIDQNLLIYEETPQ